MLFISQDGRRTLSDEQLALSRTERDEETGEYETGWEIDTDGDFEYVPMARYHSKEDVQLVKKLRVWAEHTAKLPTLRYPSADEAAALREQIAGLLSR